jgi:hypothetical protein
MAFIYKKRLQPPRTKRASHGNPARLAAAGFGAPGRRGEGIVVMRRGGCKTVAIGGVFRYLSTPEGRAIVSPFPPSVTFATP